MRSSFEELVTMNPMVKTDHNCDMWFKSYSFLNFLMLGLMHVTPSLGSDGWSDEVEKIQRIVPEESFHI